MRYGARMIDSVKARWPAEAWEIWDAAALEASSRGWLDKQLAWRTDEAFAKGFAEGVPVAGATQADYLQREIEVGESRVLAGIRFMGQRRLMPFVDLVAWDGPEPDASAAAEVVRREFAVFEPRALRVLRVGEPAAEGVRLDQSVHAARAGDFADGDVEAGVALIGWDEPEAAAELVGETYAAMGEAFCEAVVPATAEGLRDCAADGTLCRIEVGGEVAGVWATEPGKVEFLPGQIVVEEVLVERFRGRGLARSVQRLGARLLPAEAVLLGTIDRINEASRKTATRAGRPEVMRFSLVECRAGGC